MPAAAATPTVKLAVESLPSFAPENRGARPSEPFDRVMLGMTAV